MLREKARLIVISLVIGLIAAVGFYFATSGKGVFGKTAKKSAATTVNCVVAAKDIDRLTKLDKNMLKVVEVPAALAHPQAITNIDDAVGYYTKEKLYSGEVLIKPHISQRKAAGELSFTVPAGKRAISIAVNPASGVGNMLRPGDRVDVLSHIGQQTAGEDVVFTLMQDILVLAVDDRTSLDSDKKAAVAGVNTAPQNNEYKTVTLAVSAEEGNKLAYAVSVGDIRLALHSAEGQAGSAYDKTLSQESLAGMYGFKIKPAQQAGAAEQAAAPAPRPQPAAAPTQQYAAQYQPPAQQTRSTQAAAAPAAQTPTATAPAASPPPDPDSLIYVYRGSELSSVSVPGAEGQKKN